MSGFDYTHPRFIVEVRTVNIVLKESTARSKVVFHSLISYLKDEKLREKFRKNRFSEKGGNISKVYFSMTTPAWSRTGWLQVLF